MNNFNALATGLLAPLAGLGAPLALALPAGLCDCAFCVEGDSTETL